MTAEGHEPGVDGRFLATERAEIHQTKPWSQFGYANRQLTGALRRFLEESDLGDGSVVLDYGCADRQYQPLVPNNARYVGADLPGNGAADVVLSGEGTLPLPDASVDLVLSTQVLEHVESPDLYLRECHRVLTEDGTLVLSTHGLMYYHRDPEDYWRWTCAGLKRCLTQNGFAIADFAGLLGLAAAALQLFQDGTYWRIPRSLRHPYAFLMQRAIAAADRRHSDEERALNCWTMVVRARKTGGEDST
jgi:SAM-dependent methyltransferase